MTDKPILFSAPMTRALLDGRKTQTRRIIKGVPDAPAMDNIAWPDKKLHPEPYLDAYCGAKRTPENPRGMTANWAYWTRDHRPGPLFKVGYVPGDRLWVRETCRAVEHEDGTDAVEYLADGACTRIANTTQSADQWGALYNYGKKGPDRAHREGQKVPSIHMPRWASRLTLIVTDVRVQRLQEIDATDARAEGMTREYGRAYPTGPQMQTNNEVQNFAVLWNSIHGPDAWNVNPWVVALTFDVHRCNIDQMGQV